MQFCEVPLSTDGSICAFMLALGGSLVTALLSMKIGPTSDKSPQSQHGRLFCCWREVQEGGAGGNSEGRHMRLRGLTSAGHFGKFRS